MTVRVVQYLVFSVVFVFRCLSYGPFFFLQLGCLPLELRLQVTPLVFTNFSPVQQSDADF